MLLRTVATPQKGFALRFTPCVDAMLGTSALLVSLLTEPTAQSQLKCIRVDNDSTAMRVDCVTEPYERLPRPLWSSFVGDD
jgi:hypothetical protein